MLMDSYSSSSSANCSNSSYSEIHLPQNGSHHREVKSAKRQQTIHSVGKKDKIITKEPIAPWPRIPAKVYNVAPVDFRDVVQKLTGAPEFQPTRVQYSVCSPQLPTSNFAGDPISSPTMSWWTRSIASSLKLDDDEDDVSTSKSNQPESPHVHNDDTSSPNSTPRGVKDDLSDLTRTLTRQFWGVASFLAPPPEQIRHDMETDESDPDLISGIRSDFAEIGGKFKSGISKLSNNINVSEITKLASDFLQLGSDDEGEEGSKGGVDSRKGAVGVNEEVVAFVRDIAMHPETWLDFPLSENAEDDHDFDMSDTQQEHALAVERFAPRLTALRIELCPGYMSESRFWKIYFVLLHPRLDSHEAELLSTPQVIPHQVLLRSLITVDIQIVNARASLTKELKLGASTKPADVSGGKYFDLETHTGSQNEESLSAPSLAFCGDDSTKVSDIEIHSSNVLADSETAKHPIESNEIHIVDKSVKKETDTSQAAEQAIKSDFSNVLEEIDEDDADDWLKEESSEIVPASRVTIPIENEEDVSFSDLEEDDDGDVSSTLKKSNHSFKKDSPEWVQLRKSPSNSYKDMDVKHSGKKNVNAYVTKESNDWLDVDDIDVA
ncbi:hypothetical protein F511_17321 [Dorcoceras hygrometricum]|uniref:BSD domain-containing protein n=1 Tax=Dorcoceras hygrometricum TaxID=472368 RepID=A0A2Z7BD75_9LAMI|nr:hypothetical protein F511_17321 [Dorcoceras hygrometricum]